MLLGNTAQKRRFTPYPSNHTTQIKEPVSAPYNPSI